MRFLPVLAITVVAALGFSAIPTTTPPSPPKPVAAPASIPLPLRCALLYDITGSRESARIATSIDDFAPVFDRLQSTGGEVGFGFIRENSNRPLIRCYVPSPPAPPTKNEPPIGGNIFVNANNRKNEDKKRSEYDQKRRAWEADAKARINAFKLAITPLLDAPADAPATDLTAAVERGDLMLSEPSAFPNATMAIVLISDGLHNATAVATPTVRSNAYIVIVNGIGSVGALEKLTPAPIRFESTEAALRYIANNGGANAR